MIMLIVVYVQPIVTNQYKFGMMNQVEIKLGLESQVWELR